MSPSFPYVGLKLAFPAPYPDLSRDTSPQKWEIHDENGEGEPSPSTTERKEEMEQRHEQQRYAVYIFHTGALVKPHDTTPTQRDGVNRGGGKCQSG